MPERKMVRLGRLGKPHSIRGEVRLVYFADSPLLLDKPLYLKVGDAPLRPIKLESWRLWKEQPIVRLTGIQDRTAAEFLRGQELYIARDDFPELPDDEAYLSDLLGLPVFSDGQPLGFLEDISFPGGQELWHIRTSEGIEVLFPAVDEFIQSMDENGIRIAPPPGLLDIYLEGL